MRITIFEARPDDADAFATLGRDHNLRLTPDPLDELTATRHTDAEIVSTFVHSRLDARVIAEMTALRFIATRSTGYDHIDATACRARGIAVANVPEYGTKTVAEHTFALLLAVARHLPEAVGRTRSGSFVADGLEGFDLAGRTLGVIGTGNIGRHVIRVAKAFDMEVLAYDVVQEPRLATTLGFRYMSLPALLAQADVISVHVPATPKTVGLLSHLEFERMKPGVVIINTARGSVIDSQALIGALRSGKVAGAGLDVLPDEALFRDEARLAAAGRLDPAKRAVLRANRILCEMPNVVVTPHSAFLTVEAMRRIVACTIENIVAYTRGQPQNIVIGEGVHAT
ncbi:MAG: NAD(P)-dependent oxidoreductase [Gemmatimonas sp.]